MRAFAYERPTHLDDAVALLAEHGPEARLLAGGTDLIIRLRDGIDPAAGRRRRQGHRGARRRRSARATAACASGRGPSMTDIAADQRIRRDFRGPRRGGGRRRLGPDPEPGDARRQHLQRLAGRRHRAGAARLRRAWSSSPGPAGRGRIPIDEFFVRSGRHDARARRAGHAPSSCRARPARAGRSTSGGRGGAATTSRRSRWPARSAADGTTRLGVRQPRAAAACSSPTRPGCSPTRRRRTSTKMRRLEALFVDASPSPRSMRASPEYRLAMLHVLGLRGGRRPRSSGSPTAVGGAMTTTRRIELTVNGRARVGRGRRRTTRSSTSCATTSA